MSRMKLLPLPLEPISGCTVLATADVLTTGAVMTILLRWWQSGCRSLPETDSGLAALAGCSPRRWRSIRENVRQALADITPVLARLYARQTEVAKLRSSMAHNAGVASAKARHERMSGQSTVRPILAEMLAVETMPATGRAVASSYSPRDEVTSVKAAPSRLPGCGSRRSRSSQGPDATFRD
jgi:hypothetical protein